MQHYSIIDHLSRNASEYPQKTAFIVPGNGQAAEKRITYAELDMHIRDLAARMVKKRLGNKRVLLIYQDVPEFIISFMVCQYLEIIAVPVPYFKGSKQITRLLNIIDDIGASAIFCAEHSRGHFLQCLGNTIQGKGIELFSTDAAAEPGELDELASPCKIRPDAISFIQYSSGSTGKPKGVMISSGNLISNQALIREAFGCDRHSTIFSWLPFHHDMGLIGNILHTIYIGCTCILMTPFDFMQRPGRWLEGISRYQVTHSGGPNFAYDLCVDKIRQEEFSQLDLSSWKVAYNGSEPVRSSTLQRFSSRFSSAGFDPAAFFPCYGLAEATLLVAGQKSQPLPATVYIEKGLISDGRIVLSDDANPRARPVVSSGKVAAGMKVKILSTRDQRECSELEEGEICISGDSVTQGYWNLDNSGFYLPSGGQSFMRTGDLGFFYRGELYIHGRLKEMLIIRGQNFYPQDIEHAIGECAPSIEPNGVAIFNIDDNEERFVIIAEIKRSFLRDPDHAGAIYSIDQLVTGSFGITPYDIVLTTPLGIPRTTSGKLQRIKCKDNYLCNTFNVIGSSLRNPPVRIGVSKDPILAIAVIRNAGPAVIRAYLVNAIESRIGAVQQWPNGEMALTEMGIDSLRGAELINLINRDLGIRLDVAVILRDNSFFALVDMIECAFWVKNTAISGGEITI